MVKERRPVMANLLMAFMGIYSIMGIGSGLVLLLDPSGKSMGLPSDLVDRLPVSDLLWVGLFLFIVYGIVPAILTYGLASKPIWAWTDPLNRWSDHHWAWTGTMFLTLILFIWLAVEALYIGFDSPIQFITLIWGLAFLLLAFSPSVRTFYAQGAKD